MKQFFNIGLIGGTNNYFYREVKCELIALGHKVYMMQNLLEDSFNIDFILCINDIREVLPVKFASIPLVSWVGERPTWSLLWKDVRAKQADILFVTDKMFCEELKFELPTAKVKWLPLATSFEKRSPAKRCDYDLSFVGNTMLQNINEMEECRGILGLPMGKDMQNNIKDEIVEIMTTNPMIDLYELCDILQKMYIIFRNAHNSFRRDLIYAYIGMVMTYCKRQSILSGVTGKYNTLVIPEEWKKHITPLTISGYECAYEKVSNIYNRTRININISSMHMPSACNSRPFDVPMSGGFLITDKRKHIEELFDDREVVTYQSTEELHELISFYLKNDNARKKVIKAAQERVAVEHTYKNRVEKLINIVKAELM